MIAQPCYFWINRHGVSVYAPSALGHFSLRDALEVVELELQFKDSNNNPMGVVVDDDEPDYNSNQWEG